MGENENIDSTFNREKLELERQRIRIEEEKQKKWEIIEYAKLKADRDKTTWTAGSIFIPLLVVVVTLIAGLLSEQQKARDDFAAKAAEIVMNTGNPSEAAAKAAALKALFPDRLPNNFAESFEPGKYEAGSDPTDMKLELLRMISANPERKQEIVEGWVKLFPYTAEWANSLK